MMIVMLLVQLLMVMLLMMLLMVRMAVVMATLLPTTTTPMTMMMMMTTTTMMLMKIMSITVVMLLCTALGGLGMRLAWLQLVAGEQLESRARQAQTERRNPLGRRRTIVDRQGRLLAIDEERVTVWAHPRYFRWPGDGAEQRRSPREVAEKLAPILGVSAATPAVTAAVASLLKTVPGIGTLAHRQHWGRGLCHRPIYRHRIATSSGHLGPVSGSWGSGRVVIRGIRSRKAH